MRRSIAWIIPCLLVHHASCSVYDESLLSDGSTTTGGSNGNGGNNDNTGGGSGGGLVETGGSGGGNTGGNPSGGGSNPSGGDTGSGSSPGTGGEAPTSTFEYTRITDLEETSDGRIELDGGAYWFTAAAAPDCIEPTGEGNVVPVALSSVRELPAEFPTTESHYAMHFVSEEGCPGWGSQGGFGLREGATEGSLLPFDASEYTGIAFWGRADSEEKRVRLDVSDVNTHPDGGVCGNPTPECYQNFGRVVTLSEDWKLYRMPFTMLTRNGKSPETDALFQIIFSFPYADKPVDVWIDDVYFYKEIPN